MRANCKSFVCGSSQEQQFHFTQDRCQAAKPCEEHSLGPRAAAVYCVYSVSLTGSAELRSRGSSSPLLLLGSLPRSGPPLIHGDSLLSSVSGSCFLPPTSRKAFPLPADVCFPPSSLCVLPPRGSERSCMMMNVVMADTPSFLFFSFSKKRKKEIQPAGFEGLFCFLAMSNGDI